MAGGGNGDGGGGGGGRKFGKDKQRDPTDLVAAIAAAQGNVPPHDLEAERACLGGMLLDNNSLSTVESIVTAGDFYYPAHAVLYESMQTLSKRNEPVDAVTLANELRARDRLNTVGGLQYIGELTDTIATIANIEMHARIVADLAQVRRMIALAQEVVQKGFGERGNADVYLDWAAAKVFEIAQKKSKSTLIALDQTIQEAFERIEATLARGARISGTETGFRDLDSLISGMSPGQLIIIAARPAMGKTSFVLNVTSSAAKSSGLPVLFFSLEMPRVELANRLMCAEARVDQGLLRSNMLTAEHMSALTQGASKLFKLPIYIDDSGELTLLELRSKSRRMKKERGLSLIIIDYLQLMKASREAMDSREREISEISRGLKSLAKELEVPIIALSQLNRSVETRAGKDKRPQLSDLRESGAIEQDADVVMFIYRDEVYNKDTEDKGIAEIIVAKQRAGPTDSVRLRFIRELTKFENLADDEHNYADSRVGGDAPEPPSGGFDDGGQAPADDFS